MGVLFHKYANKMPPKNRRPSALLYGSKRAICEYGGHRGYLCRSPSLMDAVCVESQLLSRLPLKHYYQVSSNNICEYLLSRPGIKGLFFESLCREAPESPVKAIAELAHLPEIIVNTRSLQLFAKLLNNAELRPNEPAKPVYCLTFSRVRVVLILFFSRNKTVSTQQASGTLVSK